MINHTSRCLAHINSLSSGLMLGVTLYRNQPGVGNKCLAQIGYASTAGVATVESVVALASCIGSMALYPISSVPFERSVTWFGSSFFSIAWSTADFVMNPLVQILVADEPSARRIAQNREFMRIPVGAVV